MYFKQLSNSYNNTQQQQQKLKYFESSSIYIKCDDGFLINKNVNKNEASGESRSPTTTTQTSSSSQVLKYDEYELKCEKIEKETVKCVSYCEIPKSIESFMNSRKQQEVDGKPSSSNANANKNNNRQTMILNRKYYLNDDYLSLNCTKSLSIRFKCVNTSWYLIDQKLQNISSAYFNKLLRTCLENIYDNLHSLSNKNNKGSSIFGNAGGTDDEYTHTNLLFQLNLRTFVIVIAISGILLLLLLLVSLFFTVFNKKHYHHPTTTTAAHNNNRIVRTRTHGSITTTTSNRSQSHFDILHAYRLRRSGNNSSSIGGQNNNDQITFSIGSSSSLNQNTTNTTTPYLPTYDEAVSSSQHQNINSKPYHTQLKNENSIEINNNNTSSANNDANNKINPKGSISSNTSGSGSGSGTPHNRLHFYTNRHHHHHHQRHHQQPQQQRELDTQSSNSNNFNSILLNRSRSNSSRSTATGTTLSQTTTTTNALPSYLNRSKNGQICGSNETFGAISEACTIITNTSCNSNESNASKFVLRGSIDDNLLSEMTSNEGKNY